MGAIHGAPLGIREIHPDVAVALLARKTARVDAVALQLGIRRDRGNFAALAGVRVKSPAVVGALDRLPVARARRKRKRAVRANVAQRERFSRGVAPETSGTSSRVEVTSARPRISSLRSAGYQKPHSISPSMLDAVTPGMERGWFIVRANCARL